MGAPYLAARRRAIDCEVVEGAKKCTKCGRVKPLHAFYHVATRGKPHSWCKPCVRIATAIHRESPETAAKLRAYRSKPEVRERMRRCDEARGDYLRAYSREYAQTDRGRIIKARVAARARLRAATTEHQRRVAQACIDRHTAALAALDAEDE